MVKLVKMEPHSWHMATGDDRPGARYSVIVNGKEIGEVSKGSEESYRSDGTTSRLRWGFRGYSIYWEAKTPTGQQIGYHYFTRRDAIDALLRATPPASAD